LRGSWKIEKIVECRTSLNTDRKLEYNIKWKWFDDYTRESMEFFENGGMGAIKEFERRNLRNIEIVLEEKKKAVLVYK
jgi:hypothetical protein